ncbi:hypothetical protein [Gulosibacter molinativorax]|uniref:PD-(D/E)XK endonuclease-like domain-containing protein n=1 Tax=Gulosibacter molinativorax TaxID=256821 RepID=A0ABT7C9I7_9MICO|nr:hypothetical protein [Gulosibacter molinativorax]MDJ1371773.1 hypothetical protein [Gulosibacter molinativorax]QUY60857.1 Hypotetical protein [Gulosibacter molinativorax]
MADKPRFKRRNYGKGHGYQYLDEAGQYQKMDGVTTLLSNGLPKPALINWAANTTAEYAVNMWDELGEMPIATRLKELKNARYADRDAAAKRGTEVHDLAEKLAHGEEVDVPDEIRGHVESAAQFLDDFEVEVILTETPCFHDQALYGGTFDLLLRSGKFPDKVILADWKTNRSGIYPETALQLTAYAKSTHYTAANGELALTADLGITDLWAIWIRSDGFSVFPMEFSPVTWSAFGHIATVARTASNRDVADTWKGPELHAPASKEEAA